MHANPHRDDPRPHPRARPERTRSGGARGQGEPPPLRGRRGGPWGARAGGQGREEGDPPRSCGGSSRRSTPRRGSRPVSSTTAGSCSFGSATGWPPPSATRGRPSRAAPTRCSSSRCSTPEGSGCGANAELSEAWLQRARHGEPSACTLQCRSGRTPRVPKASPTTSGRRATTNARTYLGNGRAAATLAAMISAGEIPGDRRRGFGVAHHGRGPRLFP
jgi:hypothetical protein